MVRQRPRKAIEELYGSSKFENSKTQTTNMPQSKTMPSERELGGYLIQSKTPFTAMNLPPGVVLSSGMPGNNRRKSTGTGRLMNNRTNGLMAGHYAVDELKKDPIMNKNKGKTNCGQENYKYSGAGLCENKTFSTFGPHTHVHTTAKDVQQSMRSHSQHLHHHHHPPRVLVGRDDEKEDDADEFFDVIKNTVEKAVGKAISDVLNKNFRELSMKIDRFSTELKATNSLLNQLQTDVNNKVVHYGEENSRHFRYLCMKSEYDKMFFQHQANMGNETGNVADKTRTSRVDLSAENQQIPCTCRPSTSNSSNLKLPQRNQMTHKGGSDEISMGQKSSALDVREVIDHIQRFCTQLQVTGMCEGRPSQVSSYRNLDPLEAMKLHKKVFEEVDEDDSQMSSDGMTPRREISYGGNTMRSSRCSPGVANVGNGDN